jgi:hypothetical protein
MHGLELWPQTLQTHQAALLAVDARWNRLAEPQFFGMSLAPSTSGNVSFTVAAPATIERSNYFGNLFLIRPRHRCRFGARPAVIRVPRHVAVRF